MKDSESKLNDFGKIAEEEWLKTKQIRSNVDLDEYVIMPNHIHGIIIINSDAALEEEPNDKKLLSNSLGSIVGQYKSVVTKRIKENGDHEFGWQARYYDHIIRSERSLDSIRKYIEYNPAKWEVDEYYRR